MNIEELLFRIRNPQVYSGREINVVRRVFDRRHINVCLTFPDTYEIGMSHSGIKILYHLLNRLDGVAAERSFLPDRAGIQVFKENRYPLFSLENRIPLSEFDLIGISLLSELNFTNVLQLLDLSGIPLHSQQRDGKWPLIGAGGISIANPEPLRNIIDFFAFGDGELLMPEIVDVLKRARSETLTREQTLKALDQVEGIYVPRWYPVRSRGLFLVPDMGGKRVRKRILKDLDHSVLSADEIVPIGNVIFNRLTIEIARGCPQTCRFCQAKSYYSPFRAKGVEQTLAVLGRALDSTGFESFSLSSLSSGDHPRLSELLAAIPTVMRTGISFSVPSLRPSTLSGQLLETLSQFRRTGITIVPEAGSERLRRVINKNVTDEEIMQAVAMALEHGWQRVKLYFMIGLPGETEDDIIELIELIEKIVDFSRGLRKRLAIHVSVSSFVPKPHTPLQWAAREALASLDKKIDLIRDRLKKHRQLTIDFHLPLRGALETLLARGDSRVGELLEAAFRRGQVFTAWDADFDPSAWQQLLAEYDFSTFFSEIPVDMDLPWQHIDLNFQPSHLLAEYRRAQSALPTPDCSQTDCRQCRGCLFMPVAKSSVTGTKSSVMGTKPEAVVAPPVRPPPPFRKLRIFFRKDGDFRFFSHLTLMQYIERLLRKSGLEFKTVGLFHPRPKMASPPPLPVYSQGLAEVVELSVAGNLTETEMLERITRVAGEFTFTAVRCRETPPLGRDLGQVDYEMTCPVTDEVLAEVRRLLVDGEAITRLDSEVNLSIDYSRDGPRRFSQIYRLLDPERRMTRYLTRRRIGFKSDH